MLLETLIHDLNSAMKARDELKVGTLRFLIAAIKKYDIDTYPPASSGKLSDADVEKIIRKQVRTHEESIAAFIKGNRPELAEKETAELAILKAYLPKDLTDNEIRQIVKKAVSIRDANFGSVMGAVMKLLAGKASGERVQKLVKEELKLT